MNARELRIGNLVYKEWIENGEVPHKTEHEISGYDLEHLDVDGCFYGGGEAIPIPLSHEWMMKFEWAGIDGARYVFRDIEYYSISEDGSLFFERIYTTTDVKYIHQLQNLYFALTGEELSLQK